MKNLKVVYVVGTLIAAIFSIKYITENTLNDLKIRNILNDVALRYGKYIARNVERIYRFETDHFNSKQFKQTFTAGMMAFSPNYPYGWVTMNEIFWMNNPQFAPTGVMTFKENPGLLGDGGGLQSFVKFRNLKSAMFTLAEFLKHYGNNPGRWYSTNVEKQAKYNKALGNIELIFT